MNKRCLQLSNLECSSLRGLMLFIRNFSKIIFLLKKKKEKKEAESNCLSNGEAALVKGMAGREPGRTLSLSWETSLCCPSPQLEVTSPRQNIMSPPRISCEAVDRHRETHSMAEAVRMASSKQDAHGVALTLKRRGANGQTQQQFNFPSHLGCPILSQPPDYPGLSERVTLQAEGWDPSTHTFRDSTT